MSILIHSIFAALHISTQMVFTSPFDFLLQFGWHVLSWAYAQTQNTSACQFTGANNVDLVNRNIGSNVINIHILAAITQCVCLCPVPNYWVSGRGRKHGQRFKHGNSNRQVLRKFPFHLPSILGDKDTFLKRYLTLPRSKIETAIVRFAFIIHERDRSLKRVYNLLPKNPNIQHTIINSVGLMQLCIGKGRIIIVWLPKKRWRCHEMMTKFPHMGIKRLYFTKKLC